MPGIYGLASREDTKDNLRNMSKSMYLYEHFIQDELFYDGPIAASRVHTGLVGTDHSPVNLNDVYLWVEGEAYNISEVSKEFNLKVNSLPALLLKANKSNQLDKCLHRLDGDFCAAIYDKENQKIKLISDRYGMRPLYWYHKDGIFAWGSEVKAILAIKNINKEFNPTSYDCFMDLGQLLGDATWFSHIKLINPSSILEYDLNTNSSKQSYYWKWSNIEPSNISFNSAIDKLGEHFLHAVSKRFDPKEKIGVALSGGLDSRAIIAAIDRLYPDYVGYAYTFGIPDCDDISIAKQVIQQTKNWKHDSFYFETHDWFKPRMEMVWNTDGMQDLMHMHGNEFIKSVSDNIHINMNGYLGDAVLGGSYLQQNIPLNINISKKVAEQYYQAYAIDYDSDFYLSTHYDNYLYMMRGRRFINFGPINALPWVEQRKPFFDNQLMEFIFSLPDDYRINNKIYSEMLKQYFPKYFLNIPWQNTGKPVGIVKKPSIPVRAINKVKRELRSLFGIKSSQNYTDYPSWIRDQEVSKQLLSLLNPKNAEYTRLTDDDLSKRWLEPHLKNQKINNADQILRAATIEVYLRRVFE